MFKIAEFDLNSIADNTNIACRVDGYWSYDPISLYVRRTYSYRDEASATWSIELTHSSGGRDTNVIASDLEAERNFGHALIAMADLGVELSKHFGLFEENYQRKATEYRMQYEAEQATKQAVIDADKPLGMKKAEKLVAEFKRRATMSTLYKQQFKVYERGVTFEYIVETRMNSKVSFYMNNTKIATKALIEKLSSMSIRSADAVN